MCTQVRRKEESKNPLTSFISSDGAFFFFQIILAALSKDKAYLAVGLSPATSTIRRQQEASQALALSTSCEGLSSREAAPQHSFCYMSARFGHK